MALNTFKCYYLTPLQFKGLIMIEAQNKAAFAYFDTEGTLPPY